MQPAPVRVHLILPGKISREQVDRSLTDDEKERAGRFKFAKDAAQWSACRAGLRQILGRTLGLDPVEVPIQLSSNGKPELATPYQ
ncbi:MAG: hypothetical protein EOP85_21135, partial [Verrucomicrobiaceae bacterium]